MRRAPEPDPDHAAILRWWAANARDLPWRDTRDPWAILVSEIMAQQTQVERVIPAWTRFLERMPTPAAAAAEPVATIVELWSGLGYNRRAVMLHAAARRIVEEHGGRVPNDLDELLVLRGVGPYTARAVMVFAFEADVAVVDTNVGRILARWHGAPLGPTEVQVMADDSVPGGAAWAWNQALLDFGATVCTKRAPACSRCPVRSRCGWTGSGPDPAVGSAAVSGGQSRFEGSDRQGRGRLVAALRRGAVERDRLAAVMGWPGDDERADRVAAGVIADGLAAWSGSTLRLPAHTDRGHSRW